MWEDWPAVAEAVRKPESAWAETAVEEFAEAARAVAEVVAERIEHE